MELRGTESEGRVEFLRDRHEKADAVRQMTRRMNSQQKAEIREDGLERTRGWTMQAGGEGGGRALRLPLGFLVALDRAASISKLQVFS